MNHSRNLLDREYQSGSHQCHKYFRRSKGAYFLIPNLSGAWLESYGTRCTLSGWLLNTMQEPTLDLTES